MNESLTNNCFSHHCRIVPNPAVFWSRLRNRDGISDLIFSSAITLLTLSGVVKPWRSIKMPFKFLYLCVQKGWSNMSLTSDATSPESAAQVILYRSSSSVIWCKSNCVSIWLNHNSTSVGLNVAILNLEWLVYLRCVWRWSGDGLLEDSLLEISLRRLLRAILKKSANSLLNYASVVVWGIETVYLIPFSLPRSLC